MKVKMEYHIISGKIIETRRCWMQARDERNHTRGQRKAGNTGLSKIMANEREAVRRLARILNSNFSEGFLFVTLKYGRDRLPQTIEEANANAAAFLRKARKEHMKAAGEAMRYVSVTANWSPKRQCAARLHHHIVMDLSSIDMLEKLWPAGEFYVRVVHNTGDLTRLAAYLCANTNELEPGKKKWSSSRGLDKPIYTEPKPVEEIDRIQPMPECSVVEANMTTGEDGETTGSYMRCICHENIRVRGGMVILPRKKKKQPMPTTLDEAIWQETDE